MADQAISPSALSEPRERVSRYFAALKVPLMLLGILAAALGSYYVFYVSQQTGYLITRNFRLLATIGEHIEAAIRSDRTVLSNMRFGTQSLPEVQAEASKFIRSAQIVKWPAHTGRHDTEGAMALQFVEPNTRVAWVLRDQTYDDTVSPWQVRLSLDDLVEPLLRDHVNDGTFDALIIAAPDGRVIFQTGAAPLRVMHLARLVVSRDAKGVETTKFDDLAHAAGLVDVVIAGDQYKLFTQPCCGLMSAGTTQSLPGGPATPGSVLAQSYAVSFSIMAVISIALLLALLSWPFVKLFLIGDAQRVKVHDVVLVGTSALLGIALITICALDLYAYKTLEGTLDDQLEMFAHEITGRANDEIKAAVGQLAQLESAVDRPEFPGPKFPEAQSVSDLAGDDAARSKAGVKRLLLSDADLSSYPDFESFSLIDENGEQRQKMTLGSFVTPRIFVDDREYFIHWTTPAADPAPFFEPIQSATTRAREAVV